MKVRNRLLLALCLPWSALAFDVSRLQPSGHVNDFAQVINPAHRAELEHYCRQLAAATQAEISVVTVPTLDGEPIDDIALKLYRAWGIGNKGQNEGALLLLATNDRRMWLEAGAGLAVVFPSGYSGSLLRSMRPLLREREYGPALIEAVHQIGSRISEHKKVPIDASLPSRRMVTDRAHHVLPPLLIPVGFVLVILVVVILVWRGRCSRGMPGAHESTGGGGFGDYDSSDSFGAFGGDDRGGGDSCDW